VAGRLAEIADQARQVQHHTDALAALPQNPLLIVLAGVGLRDTLVS